MKQAHTIRVPLLAGLITALALAAFPVAAQAGTLASSPPSSSYNAQPYFFGSQFNNFEISDSGTDTAVGNAAITGPDAARFSFNGDACSGFTLTNTQICHVGVSFNPPNSPGSFSAHRDLRRDSQRRLTQPAGHPPVRPGSCRRQPGGDAKPCRLRSDDPGNDPHPTDHDHQRRRFPGWGPAGLHCGSSGVHYLQRPVLAATDESGSELHPDGAVYPLVEAGAGWVRLRHLRQHAGTGPTHQPQRYG